MDGPGARDLEPAGKEVENGEAFSRGSEQGSRKGGEHRGAGGCRESQACAAAQTDADEPHTRRRAEGIAGGGPDGRAALLPAGDG